MAYASLISLTQTLEHILHSDQSRLYKKQHIISLHERANFLLSFLENSSQNNRETIRRLEGRVRDATYGAEDMIDSHMFRQMLSNKFGHRKLQKVIEELDSISEEVLKMKGRNDLEDLPPRKLLPAGLSESGSGNKSAMVGFDDDLIRIKDQLTRKSSKLEIVSIVGMGGIGKTTLARNLYDDSLIVYHFHIRGWMTVSQQYSVPKMILSLQNSTRHFNGESDQDNIDELAGNLYRSLKGRRYLIVMDDVWDANAWEDIKRFLPDDNNGSRIILTTRLSDVADYVNSFSPIHRLSLLSPEQSWNLLRDKAFEEECCPPEFEVFGRMIAEKCKGLPLALVVIGGLLNKGKRTQQYWRQIANNASNAVTQDDDQVMEILSLSYDHLPHHLRACFLYMGVFPGDSEIIVSHIIKLWVATGFLKPVRHKSLEEVAKEHLEDLIDRNLIMVRKQNDVGEIKTCSIHDIMRDLCVAKAQEENFLRVMNRHVEFFHEGTTHCHRLTINTDVLDRLREKYDPTTHLYFGVNHASNLSLFSFTTSFRLIRVLDALAISFNEFPTEILELVTLRYIALTYRGHGKLPASISRLYNLQTLILYRGKFAWNTVCLPVEIWKMSQLRHLLFDGCFLAYPSGALNRKRFLLESLQTLSAVTNFRFTKETLRIIPNLKKLGISYHYDSQTTWSSYRFENLVHLPQLENLKCLFIPKAIFSNPLPVNFAFPQKLKKLTLSGSRISWKNMSIVGSLPNLEVLKLKNRAFEGLVWETTEGEFRQLKFLLIDRTNLKSWKTNETHFPSLRHLSIMFCPQLVEIPPEMGEIPTLQVMELYKCCPSAVTSAEFIQEEQHSLGNVDLEVHVYSEYPRRAYNSLRKKHLR